MKLIHALKSLVRESEERKTRKKMSSSVLEALLKHYLLKKKHSLKS